MCCVGLWLIVTCEAVGLTRGRGDSRYVPRGRSQHSARWWKLWQLTQRTLMRSDLRYTTETCMRVLPCIVDGVRSGADSS